MKTDRVGKLYEGLSENELAALAFDNYMAHNFVEVKRIVSAVTNGRQYNQHYSGLFDMMQFWAMEYWRNMALYLAALAKYKNAKLTGADYQELHEHMALIDTRLEVMASLEAALMAVCARYNVNYEHIRRYAGAIEPFPPYPDESGIQETNDVLTSLITGQHTVAMADAAALLNFPIL